MTGKTMLINNSGNDDFFPLEFFLSQNYPNPFKQKTTIKYCVAYKTRVNITVYDSDHKIVEKLVDEVKNAGTYEAEFKSVVCNRQLLSGNYSYQLEAGDYKCEKRMEIIA